MNHEVWYCIDGLPNRNFYKELIQKAGAETELVYMKASKELLQKRLYKRNQVLNANSPFVITDEILEHHYHAFQEPWGEGEKDYVMTWQHK